MIVPILTTGRLVLRPFREDDAPVVEHLLSTPHVSRYTLSFPYPYPPGAALAWIRRHLASAGEGTHLQWAITLPGDELAGAVGLTLHQDPSMGDLGYWIGVVYWNQGYATEAARAVIAFGFSELHLPRIEAMCFSDNLASARVLEKAGLVFEELREARAVRPDQARDVLVYGLSRSGWSQQ
jgi:[ribosomal protein S5]-alanine N-acetyltransferase